MFTSSFIYSFFIHIHLLIYIFIFIDEYVFHYECWLCQCFFLFFSKAITLSFVKHQKAMNVLYALHRPTSTINHHCVWYSWNNSNSSSSCLNRVVTVTVYVEYMQYMCCSSNKTILNFIIIIIYDFFLFLHK